MNDIDNNSIHIIRQRIKRKLTERKNRKKVKNKRIKI